MLIRKCKIDKLFKNFKNIIFFAFSKFLKCAFFAFLITFFSLIIFRIFEFRFFEGATVKNSIKFTKTIVVDATLLMGKGGISFLTKFIIKNVAQKRTDWRFVVIVSQDTADFLDDLESVNIELQKVKTCYFAPFVYAFEFLNFLTLKHFNNELVQFFFFDRVVVDKNCDIIWYPEANIDYLRFDIPKIVTIHDLIAKELPFCVSYDAEYIFDCVSRLAKSALKIITVSNFSKNKIMNYISIDEWKIKVIPIEIFLKRADFSDEDMILTKYKLSKEKYLIYISAFWRHKNHLKLLKAFSKITQKYSDIKLVLVGSHMTFNNEVYCLLNNLGINDKVIFTNYISENEKYILLKNAKMLVHPSLYEGFGMPVVEAMSFGVPVVCSRGGSLPEIVQDAAKMFNPYDENDIFSAILETLDDEKLQKKLKNAGARRVKNFLNNERMIFSYIDIFQDV